MSRTVFWTGVLPPAGLAMLLTAEGAFSLDVLQLFLLSAAMLGVGIVGGQGPEVKTRDVWSFVRDHSQPTGLRVGHAIGSASALLIVASVAVEIIG